MGSRATGGGEMAAGVDVGLLRISRRDLRLDRLVRQDNRQQDTRGDRQNDERDREREGAGGDCLGIEPPFDVTCCVDVRVGLLEGLVHAPS